MLLLKDGGKNVFRVQNSILDIELEKLDIDIELEKLSYLALLDIVKNKSPKPSSEHSQSIGNNHIIISFSVCKKFDIYFV